MLSRNWIRYELHSRGISSFFSGTDSSGRVGTGFSSGSGVFTSGVSVSSELISSSCLFSTGGIILAKVSTKTGISLYIFKLSDKDLCISAPSGRGSSFLFSLIFKEVESTTVESATGISNLGAPLARKYHH